jgi:hypothetical protein
VRELTTDNILEFPGGQHPDERASARLFALHFQRAQLADLSADIGTPDEWLGAAINHLKGQASGPERAMGTARVSVAAIDLVMMKVEELLHGGPAWPGGRADG